MPTFNSPNVFDSVVTTDYGRELAARTIRNEYPDTADKIMERNSTLHEIYTSLEREHIRYSPTTNFRAVTHIITVVVRQIQMEDLTHLEVPAQMKPPRRHLG